MKRQIFIHIGDPTLTGDMPEEVHWVVKDEGKAPGPVFHGDLKTAANHAYGCKVLVLVSGVEVVLTQVEMPAMNRQRMIKAIPYTLEEQLASDVDDLHFAVGERQEDGFVNCAIIERKIIEMWLENLKHVGIEPDVLTTEVFGVPHTESEWTLLIKNAGKMTNAKAIMRQNLQAGMALDVPNIVPLMRAQLESQDEEHRPSNLRVIICDESKNVDSIPVLDVIDETQASEEEGTEGEEFIDYVDDDKTVDVESAREVASAIERKQSELNTTVDQLQTLAESLSVGIQIEDINTSYLVYVADQFQENKGINLLQGDYSRRERLEKLFRPWRPAVAVGLVWLILQATLVVFDYHRLSSKDQELRNRVVQIYMDAFPDAKNVPEPKTQMEQKLTELRQQAHQSIDIFTLLAKAGDVLSDTETLLIKTMRFKSETLDLDLEISDLQALDELKLRLVKEASMNVDIQSASSRKGKVESRMQLTLGKGT